MVASDEVNTPQAEGVGNTTHQGATRNNRRATNNRQNLSAVTIQSTDGASFEGSCSEIGAVMGLRTEKITKKVPFSIFVEKLGDYIITDIKYGSDIENCVRRMEDPFLNFETKHKPTSLTTQEPSFDDKMLQQERLKAYVLRENQLKDNIIKVYGLLWRQCSSALQAVIKGNEEFKLKSSSHDLLWLLKDIKKIVSGVDVKANAHQTMFEALIALVNTRQQQSESNDHYMERFKSNVNTLEMAKGGHIFCSRELVKIDKDKANPTDHQVSEEEEKFKAAIFLRRSDDVRYKDLINDLKSGSHLGRDEYPITAASCFDLLNRHSGELDKYKKNNRQNSNNGRTGAMFAQRGTNNNDENNNVERQSQNSGEPVAGTDGRLLPSIKCYNCQSMGHYAGQCPSTDARQGTNGSGFVQFGFCHTQSKTLKKSDPTAVIDRDWLLLETYSTHSVCANVDLLENLRSCNDEETLHIVTNGGLLSYNVIGDCKLIPVQMHYNGDSIANVLSLKSVTSIPGAHVTMDSNVERAISVKLPNRVETIKFIECSDGLYYHNTKKIATQLIIILTL